MKLETTVCLRAKFSLRVSFACTSLIFCVDNCLYRSIVAEPMVALSWLAVAIAVSMCSAWRMALLQDMTSSVFERV